MFDIKCYILLIIYFILLILWSVLLIKGNQKNQAILSEKYLPRKHYPFRELIGVGLTVLDMLHYSFGSVKDLKKIAQMKGIYGERWGIFYYKVNMAEKIGYGLTLALAGLLAVPMSGEWLLIILSPAGAALGVFLVSGKVSDTLSSREEAILKEFPNMVSNLALLINSGMDTYSAWNTISKSSSGVLYDEMKKTIHDMQTQGTSEMQAYVNFGSRCAVPRVTKFIAMMVQNIRKGSDDLITFLVYESSRCWVEKKNRAKVQGEKAGNKLMIPIFMIMAGILILIMGPMAANLGL